MQHAIGSNGSYVPAPNPDVISLRARLDAVAEEVSRIVETLV